MDEIVE